MLFEALSSFFLDPSLEEVFSHLHIDEVKPNARPKDPKASKTLPPPVEKEAEKKPTVSIQIKGQKKGDFFIFPSQIQDSVTGVVTYSWKNSGIEVKQTTTGKGLGVFATRTLPKRTWIPYLGRVIYPCKTRKEEEKQYTLAKIETRLGKIQNPLSQYTRQRKGTDRTLLVDAARDVDGGEEIGVSGLAICGIINQPNKGEKVNVASHGAWYVTLHKIEDKKELLAGYGFSNKNKVVKNPKPGKADSLQKTRKSDSSFTTYLKKTNAAIGCLIPRVVKAGSLSPKPKKYPSFTDYLEKLKIVEPKLTTMKEIEAWLQRLEYAETLQRRKYEETLKNDKYKETDEEVDEESESDDEAETDNESDEETETDDE